MRGLNGHFFITLNHNGGKVDNLGPFKCIIARTRDIDVLNCNLREKQQLTD